MLYLIIAGFIKAAVFTYAAIIGTTDLFQFQDHKKLTLPIGLFILLTAMMIAKNYAEHIEEGLKVVPIYVHWPFQIIIPLILLGVAYFRNRHNQQEAVSIK